uniref:Ig-like domain-containing protein n=1 Tax=Erpetoichthys calabaricus TaxID=27687 RepID=A0A8C4RYY3_ERPCA
NLTCILIKLRINLIISDSVTNTETELSGTEGKTVTLQCSYSTASNNPLLYWYRRYPNQALHYMLLRGAKSASSFEHKAGFAHGRFSSTTAHDSTELQISALSLSDSAIYYCALSECMVCKYSVLCDRLFVRQKKWTI